MRDSRQSGAARPSALALYSQSMGRLLERRLTDAALLAARREAEREAAEATQAKLEIERTTAALRAEMALRQTSQSRLAFLASHDPLTELPNRTLFNERLAAAMHVARRRGEQIALLYIDLDNFKDVNDTLGHAVGDGLLREVASRIEISLRPGDLLARVGGDEFAVIQLDAHNCAQAGDLGSRLIAALAQPFEIERHRIFVGASIGITFFPADADQIEQLHRNADLAMYRAKSDGRNRFHFFDHSLNGEVHRRALLEQGLRAPDLMSQLTLVFQPQVALRQGARVSGVEALLRWRHPVHGLISPEEFVPVAERSGVIQEIGSWVLHESCRQAARWRAEGLTELTMSVNVSTVQFRVGNLPRQVADVLADTGLPARCLELEITETGIMHDMHVAAETLVSLHHQGVGLAIDDFGTGYSSLSYLRSVPVDRIKIDRSFVRDVTVSEDAAVIASTIVQLAHSLRLQVVAEGVETADQAAFMRQAACDFVQGYYYGKPMPPIDVARLLAPAPDRVFA